MDLCHIRCCERDRAQYNVSRSGSNIMIACSYKRDITCLKALLCEQLLSHLDTNNNAWEVELVVECQEAGHLGSITRHRDVVYQSGINTNVHIGHRCCIITK